MSSKEAMLATLRQNIPSATELPPLDDSAWNTFEDKFGQFRTMLEAVGGKCEVVANVGELNECLAQIEPFYRKC